MIHIEQPFEEQLHTLPLSTGQLSSAPTAVPSVDHPAARPATTTITEERTETEDGPVAHIVKTKPGEDAAAKVLQARIEGTPIEALCGHVWVPNRDPKQLPVCEKCKDIYGMYREFNDDLGDSPRM